MAPESQSKIEAELSLEEQQLSAEEQEAYENQGEDFFPDDDGQPDEYTEWQDYMGGDDWDHGQYDDAF